MSKIDPIKPVSVTYALCDVFNYLDENIAELEGKLELAEQSEQDATLTIGNCGYKILMKNLSKNYCRIGYCPDKFFFDVFTSRIYIQNLS